MFLSADELREMTGRLKRPEQEAWLREHGLAYTVSRAGKVNVLRALVERLHGLDSRAPARSDEPDFSVFDRHDRKTSSARL